MKGLIRLFLLTLAVFLGGVVLVRLVYNVSWIESMEIADQFVEDLLC